MIAWPFQQTLVARNSPKRPKTAQNDSKEPKISPKFTISFQKIKTLKYSPFEIELPRGSVQNIIHIQRTSTAIFEFNKYCYDKSLCKIVFTCGRCIWIFLFTKEAINNGPLWLIIIIIICRDGNWLNRYCLVLSHGCQFLGINYRCFQKFP